ncbi:MAG: chorismate synthase [Peptostreptococcaceae bacterium]|nr:chorismate synthase [Peptostreptococcaceae bacterium]
MSSTWGRNIRLTIFGESHGTCVGGVIDGLPPGTIIPFDTIEAELKRRRPGGKLATPRNETDSYEILSGIFQGKTTGAPLAVIFRNSDIKSGDYEDIRKKPRPSHADYVSIVKFNGYGDHRGGGRFSGRLTAFLVFAGALAKSILSEKQCIEIGSHFVKLGHAIDRPFETEITSDELKALKSMDIPFLDESLREKAASYLEEYKVKGDSIGAIVETAAIGIPAGWGEPFFDSIESVLAGLLYSIPGVKGVDFGLGFGFADLKGSEANDAFLIRENAVETITNRSGGINGGITNGMPVVFRAAFRPTPSISREQKTVDMDSMENTRLSISGRHDPCIAVRALPVVEAALALTLLDFLMEGEA